MRIILSAGMALVAVGCGSPYPPEPPSVRPEIAAAERLVDAFYSFDPEKLRAAMPNAAASRQRLLYYQGWAEGGNYKIEKRQPCRVAAKDEVICDITVRDDLIAALRTGYWVTDRFHLTFRNGRIVEVRNSSNDPPDFDQALTWVKSERPEILTGPCKGFFAGGPTPQDCVRAIVAGFVAYRSAHPRT